MSTAALTCSNCGRPLYLLTSNGYVSWRHEGSPRPAGMERCPEPRNLGDKLKRRLRAWLI